MYAEVLSLSLVSQTGQVYFMTHLFLFTLVLNNYKCTKLDTFYFTRIECLDTNNESAQISFDLPIGLHEINYLTLSFSLTSPAKGDAKHQLREVAVKGHCIFILSL